MDGNKSNEKGIKEIVTPFLQKWYWFFTSVTIALILAVLYIKSTVPLYKIQTSVLIKEASKMSAASGDFSALQSLSGFSGMGTNSIENEIEIFKSKKLIEKAINDINTQVSVYAKQTFYDVELYKNTSPITVNIINEKEPETPFKGPVFIKILGDKIILTSKEFKKDIHTTFGKTVSFPFANIIFTKNNNYNAKKNSKLDLSNLYFTYKEYEQNVEDFQRSLEVDLINKDATVIGLNMIYHNKEKAKDILNTMVLYYNSFAINDKNIESSRTKDFIDERIVLISKELGEVENKKESFKTENNIVDIPSEARINLEFNTDAKKRILQLDTQSELIDMLTSYLSKQSSTQVLPTNIGLDNAEASSNIVLYNKLILERNRLSQNATDDNPILKDLNSQISNIRTGIMQSLHNSKNDNSIVKSKILNQLNLSESKIDKIPNQEKIFRNIERQQQIKENLFLLLLQKREEAAITMANTSEKARVIDDAFASRKPVSPKKIIVLFGAMIFGLGLPLLLLYLKQSINNKIVSRKDLQNLSETAILSEIPRSVGQNNIIKHNDVSPMAESFRILITNLNYLLSLKKSAKVIFVTSSVKGEGKTFISVNTALALATPLRKVLVIGSDIRNPQLQRYNPSMKSAVGLTEYLYGAVQNSSDIIHSSELSINCDFIYSGSIPPNPTELLENGRYKKLIEEVENLYDFIILDTAPLMLVTDSFLFADIADATVYVVRSEYSEKDFIEFANEKIETQKLKNTAFVLNDVHQTNFGYGNKYGYGYNVDKKKWWNFK